MLCKHNYSNCYSPAQLTGGFTQQSSEQAMVAGCLRPSPRPYTCVHAFIFIAQRVQAVTRIHDNGNTGDAEWGLAPAPPATPCYMLSYSSPCINVLTSILWRQERCPPPFLLSSSESEESRHNVTRHIHTRAINIATLNPSAIWRMPENANPLTRVNTSAPAHPPQPVCLKSQCGRGCCCESNQTSTPKDPKQRGNTAVRPIQQSSVQPGTE